MEKHITVFAKEALDLLNIDSGVYVDFTLGGGGHSQGILDTLKEGTLICFDVDANSIDEFKNKLQDQGYKITHKNSFITLKNAKKQVMLVNDNFTKIDDYLKEMNIQKIDGALADLGWSTTQITTIPGLSYQNLDDDLDMRLDANIQIKASDLLNFFNKKELTLMFERYADIYGKDNARLVEQIIKFRTKSKFVKTEDLVNVANSAFSNFRKTRGFGREQFSVMARIFQALRIAVNYELMNLAEVINKSIEVLNNNAVLAVITFHSGEEKVVKTTIANKKNVEIVSKKADSMFFMPTIQELKDNLRSRSAKLWAIKKI